MYISLGIRDRIFSSDNEKSNVEGMDLTSGATDVLSGTAFPVALFRHTPEICRPVWHKLHLDLPMYRGYSGVPRVL